MNKLAPFFTATALVLSGAAYGAGSSTAAPSDPSAGSDASQAQVTKPKGFVVIQRNIFVPVDAEGNMAKEHAVVIDKQGFVTTEEFEAAARAGGDEAESDAAQSEGNAEPSEPNAQKPEPTMNGSTPSLHRAHPPGEGPMIRS